MSRIRQQIPVVIQRLTVAAIGFALVSAPSLRAQAPLGAPFIGDNVLSFQSAEITRNGGAETTTLFGLAFGHRFGSDSAANRVTMLLRGTARAFDDVESGIMNFAASAGLSRRIAVLPAASVAASTGIEMMAWGDDIAETGRLRLSVPMNLGVSYALRLGAATIEPFVAGAVSYYDLRTGSYDARESVRAGWDSHHVLGASLRLKEVVASASRIVGEYGMPHRSRWAVAAGISY
jgi:hypothetical protein